LFSIVVWNPWALGARELSDFGDDEYPNMVCVEAGQVSAPVMLLPGTAFEASQILQVRFHASPARCSNLNFASCRACVPSFVSKSDAACWRQKPDRVNEVA